MIQNTTLFKSLQKKEEKLYGEKFYPLSNNITENLIPVAEILLNRIPAYMPQYTLHNIKHCEDILNNISKFLPEEIDLNIVEIYILIQAVILHDIGMVINEENAEKIKQSDDFKSLFIEFDKDTHENEILTEYIRRTHVERSLEYIDIFKRNTSSYKIRFDFKNIDLSDWIKKVIYSHSIPVEKLYSDGEFPPDKLIDDYEVNIKYLSILLRLGDILDFDIFRTPYFLYKHINPENKISNDEWQKHLSIEGRLISPSTIKFEAKCSSAKIERSVHNFISWIDEERQDSIILLSHLDNPNYFLRLNDKVELKVRNDGTYIYTDLKLDLDYKKVLKILMGTELYETPDVFIRELLQNAYDACKYRTELAKRAGEAYDPKISVYYDKSSNILTVEDNGVGMDFSPFENYVLKIGNSYYKSKSFEREQLNFSPISNFGIGILSCFMVSNTIEINSLKYSQGSKASDPINYTLHFNDRYIDKKKSNKRSYGTIIELNLHKDYYSKFEKKDIVEIIKENTSHQKIPITIKINSETKILNQKEIEIPEEYLSITDIEIIEFNKIPWLEGFMVIHKGQHQQIIESSKISQQGFTISSKGRNNLNLTIGWLDFTRYFMNIRADHKLNLRASRNSVKDDGQLSKLKNIIIEIVIDYFKNPLKKNQLNNYLSSGRGNVLSGHQVELNFLFDSIDLNLFNPQLRKVQTLKLKTFVNRCSNKSNVMVISPLLLIKLLSDTRLYEEIRNYDYVLISQNFIQYFYQLSEPYILKNEIIVSEIPGLVYNCVDVHKNKSIKIGNYDLKYSWNRSYNIQYKHSLKTLFCVVNNNQYNSMDIQINSNHVLGALLKETSTNSYTKRFIGSFKTNISYALINKTKLTQYFSHNGESHFMVNNQHAYSLDTIGFMDSSFIVSLNKSLDKELLRPLAQKGTIKEISKYFLSENDFPEWWLEK